MNGEAFNCFIWKKYAHFLFGEHFIIKENDSFIRKAYLVNPQFINRFDPFSLNEQSLQLFVSVDLLTEKIPNEEPHFLLLYYCFITIIKNKFFIPI